jgi:hypothetical protein
MNNFQKSTFLLNSIFILTLEFVIFFFLSLYLLYNDLLYKKLLDKVQQAITLLEL